MLPGSERWRRPVKIVVRMINGTWYATALGKRILVYSPGATPCTAAKAAAHRYEFLISVSNGGYS